MFNSRENNENNSDSSETRAARANNHAHPRQARDKQTRVQSIHALPIQCKHYSITATKQGGAQGFRGTRYKNTLIPMCDAFKTMKTHGNPRHQHEDAGACVT